ncbi:MAG TPA: D-alanine--D-alanine ligase [Actinomycetota bacterium]|nr:D-alanine--D-alanine ligase [Actinomycetota bacterium]
MTRVAVLAGGRSPEREVSIRSGHRVHQALAGRGHEAFLLDPSDAPLVEGLASGRADVCYLALHGRDGEDGTIQRLLELIRLPYTGTAPFECQLAFDKVLAKEALRAAGVPTPEWATIQAAALKDLSAGRILDVAAERVGFPAVVKPARSGSAMGVRFVDREAELPAAVMSALSFSDAAIIERKIEGTEVAAGLVGNPAEALPLVEIVPKSGVYDYASRYTAGATEYFAPARLEAEIGAACAREAARSFRALGLRDVTRVDLMVDRQGRPWVLEVNVSPGMTETSLLPMAAEAAGIPLETLCERILEAALARN